MSEKPLVVYISQMSEWMSLYKLVLNLTISKPGLNAVTSTATLGCTDDF
jgi:hypothetical protein